MNSQNSVVVNSKDKQRVTTGKVRFSYLSVATPQVTLSGDEKYTVTLLIPKSDKTTLDNIKKAMANAKDFGVSKKWNNKAPAKLANPLHDGDGVKETSGEPYGDECKGCFVMTASCKKPPFLFDRSGQTILDRNDIKSGDYGRAQIIFSAYDSNGKKGIGCYLEGLQKIKEGEALGGGLSESQIAQRFKDGYVDDEEPAYDNDDILG